MTAVTTIAAGLLCMNKLKSGARLSILVKRLDLIPKTVNVMRVILHVHDNSDIDISSYIKLNLY